MIMSSSSYAMDEVGSSIDEKRVTEGCYCSVWINYLKYLNVNHSLRKWILIEIETKEIVNEWKEKKFLRELDDGELEDLIKSINNREVRWNDRYRQATQKDCQFYSFLSEGEWLGALLTNLTPERFEEEILDREKLILPCLLSR